MSEIYREWAYGQIKKRVKDALKQAALSIPPEDVSDRQLSVFGPDLILLVEEAARESIVELRAEIISISLLKESIETLGSSTRTRHILQNANIKTLGDLVQWSEKRLAREKNCGKWVIREIKELLAKNGLSLRRD